MDERDQNKQEKGNSEETKKIKAAEENLDLIPYSNKRKIVPVKNQGVTIFCLKRNIQEIRSQKNGKKEDIKIEN